MGLELVRVRPLYFGDDPNVISESTASSSGLSDFFALTELRRELSEFFSAYYLCVKANSVNFLRNSPSLQNSTSQNSIPPVS